MPAPRKYPQELRDRAVRLVTEARQEEPELSVTAAVVRIGTKVGVNPDTLRGWVKQADVDTATSTTTASRYYTHQGTPVAVRTGNPPDKLISIITDHQNTPRHQIRNSDSNVQTTWQNPYGNKRGTTPTNWTGKRGFVGGTNDTTGLIHIGARDYDPALQRFTTVDPVQNTTDPLQWNPYTYSQNTPVTLSDPTGELACIDSCDWDRRRFDPAVHAREVKRLSGKWPARTPKRYKRWGYIAHPKTRLPWG